MSLKKLSAAILAYDEAKKAYDQFQGWGPDRSEHELECELRTALGHREREVIEAARGVVTHSFEVVVEEEITYDMAKRLYEKCKDCNAGRACGLNYVSFDSVAPSRDEAVNMAVEVLENFGMTVKGIDYKEENDG